MSVLSILTYPFFELSFFKNSSSVIDSILFLVLFSVGLGKSVLIFTVSKSITSINASPNYNTSDAVLDLILSSKLKKVIKS